MTVDTHIVCHIVFKTNLLQVPIYKLILSTIVNVILYMYLHGYFILSAFISIYY